VGEEVNSGESRGWPLPSTAAGMGKERGLASNVSVQGMPSSPSLSKHAGKSERCDTNSVVKEPETLDRRRLGTPC